jgi:prevent-host-death family protein
MSKTISAADANRNFSRLLRDVREGGEHVITSHGKPVARLVPMMAGDGVRAAARGILFRRLRAQRVTAGPRRWTRESLYDA